ncbi:MAG: DUF47 family protein [Candidatus Dormibacteria bacterium]
MRLSLIPRERRFYDLFDQQAANIVAACGILAAIESPTELAERHAEIKAFEHAGDEVTHEVVRMLNRTFVTPFDREDVYDLASGMDDLLDFADEVADVLTLYGVTVIPAPVRELSELFRLASLQLQQAVGKLQAQHDMDGHWVEVHRIENEGDDVSRRAIAELFRGDVAPLEVIKLKEIYALLEEALDRCEDVANTLESITIKNG